MGRAGKSILIADGDDRMRLRKYKKDFGMDKIKNIQVPLRSLDPLRADIEKLKSIEKAEFKNDAQGRDIKWKQKVANEIGIDLSEEEQQQETAATQEKKAEIREKKTHVKENLFTKQNQATMQKRRNVFLSVNDMKSIAEQLEEIKRSQSAQVRSASNTSFEKAKQRARSKGAPRNGTPARTNKKTDDFEKFDPLGPFAIGKMASQNLNKRPPKTVNSKKKYGRGRR